VPRQSESSFEKLVFRTENLVLEQVNTEHEGQRSRIYSSIRRLAIENH